MTTVQPDLAALGANLRRAMGCFAAIYESVRAAFQRVIDSFRRLWAVVSPSTLRRLLWTGIARRHAERPPTRGFWLRRCACFACRERKGLA